MIGRIYRSIRAILEEAHPPKLLLLGYGVYVLVGWLLLLLPICHTKAVSILDNLFIATSAVSTTGLVTVTIGEVYSFLGQLVILSLIQLGGIGYSTLASFVVLSATRKLSRFQEQVSLHNFPLPKGFVVPEFLRHVVVYTFVCEAIGAVVLSLLFKAAGETHYIWDGIFHSISAFCTAGFSVFPTGLVQYATNYPLNITISILSILGGVGFIVWLDLFKRIMGQKNHTTFTTRIILSVTFWSLLIGTVLFFLTNPFPENFTFGQQVLSAFFQTMTSSTTAGFNTLPIGGLSFSAITLLLFLMAFGASPSGTGGGLKSTTFTALLGLVKSTLRSEADDVSFWGHTIPASRMRIASSTFAYYIFVLVTALFTLTVLEDLPFLPLLFEASSALSTVGLSMGITSSLSEWGKSFIIFCMLMGRVGILTFSVAFLVQKHTKHKPEDDHDIVF